MKRKKIYKFIFAILVFITLFNIFSGTVSALSTPIDERFKEGDKSPANNTIATIIAKIISIVQIIATGVALTMLIVIAVRWMVASPTGKSDLARTSRYYVLGAVLIFAAIGILQIIRAFTSASFGNAGGFIVTNSTP